ASVKPAEIAARRERGFTFVHSGTKGNLAARDAPESIRTIGSLLGITCDRRPSFGLSCASCVAPEVPVSHPCGPAQPVSDRAEARTPPTAAPEEAVPRPDRARVPC